MKKTTFILSAIVIILSMLITAAAHPGNTDKYGGHWDHSTGTYHYHTGDSTEPLYAYNSSDKNVHEHYTAGYDKGYEDGLNQSQADSYDKGYNEGYKTAEEKYELPESTLKRITNAISAFINKYLMIIVLILSAFFICYTITLNHIRRVKSFRTELKCNGIARYRIKVNILNRNQDFYTNMAEVMVYTKLKYCRARYNREELIESTTHYFLHHFTWPNGQEIYLYNINENDGGYVYPELHFNEEVKLSTRQGEEYTVILLSETTHLTGEQIKEIHAEKEKIRRKEERVKKHIDKLLDDKTCQHDFFANIFADYKYTAYAKMADDLINKIPSAPKAAETVRRLAKELRITEKKYKNLKYKLNMYGIKDVENITLEDAKHLQAAQKYLADNKTR